MKQNALLLLSLLLVLFTGCNDQKITSPDGAVTAFITDANDKLLLNIYLHGSEAAQWEIGGIAFEDEAYDFTGVLQCQSLSFSEIDEEYTLPTGKVSAYVNKANEMTLTYANAAGKEMRLLVRAYNDGVAFRYAFDNSEELIVKKELTAVLLPESSSIWAMEYRNDSEGYYTKRSLSEMTKPPYHMPALVETPKGHWLLIHEADVLGRSAASFLTPCGGSGKLAFSSDQPTLEWSEEYMESNPWTYINIDDENTIIAAPNWATPWRMLIVGDTPGTIVESVMTENLNPPASFNYSWVKPGVAVFPWWGDNHANGFPDVLKKYIDMAAAMTWSVIEFDVSLIGSPDYAKDYWITTPWVKEVTQYGNDRGVLSYGWDERRNLDTPEERAFIYGKYKELGVDGIKIDFVNSHTQRACDFRRDCLADAAKFNVLVSFHGDYTPRGERRTYPNLMTNEGVKGSEYYLFAPDNDIPTPCHNATLPFTRNVIGAMDYTPTAYSTPRRVTSYAHETAQPFVYESGWVAMCDVPESFLNSPARKVLEKAEASWDEIKFLAGYPGEYVVIARRKGDKWTVGALNGGAAREVTIPLCFLPEGCASLLVCEDDPSNPRDNCVVKTLSIEGQETLTFAMSENGGFVAVAE